MLSGSTVLLARSRLELSDLGSGVPSAAFIVSKLCPIDADTPTKLGEALSGSGIANAKFSKLGPFEAGSGNVSATFVVEDL